MKTTDEIKKAYRDAGYSEHEVEQVDAMVAKINAKAKRTEREVIGWEIKVKTGKNSATSGEVIRVEHDGFTFKGRSLAAVFKVTLACGTARAERVFRLSTFHDRRKRVASKPKQSRLSATISDADRAEFDRWVDHYLKSGLSRDAAEIEAHGLIAERKANQ